MRARALAWTCTPVTATLPINRSLPRQPGGIGEIVFWADLDDPCEVRIAAFDVFEITWRCNAAPGVGKNELRMMVENVHAGRVSFAAGDLGQRPQQLDQHRRLSCRRSA